MTQKTCQLTNRNDKCHEETDMHVRYHDTVSFQVKRGAKKPTDPMFKQQWFLNHGAKVRNQLA